MQLNSLRFTMTRRRQNANLAQVEWQETPAPLPSNRAIARQRCLMAQVNRRRTADQWWGEQVQLESPFDVGHAGLAGFPGWEVAGFLGFPGAGTVRAVAGEEAGHEDLQQERGEREIRLVRGKKP